MSVDRYSPCLCGSGKKVKFCCCADIVGELEKIQKMLEGEQRLACLEHVTHTLEKYPGRAALLSVKGLLELELGQFDQAEKSIDAFIAVMPDSQIAWAEKTRLLLRQGKSQEALQALQKALHIAEGKLAMRVVSAIGEIAMVMLEEGHIQAAKAHLLLHVSMLGERDRSGMEMLMQLNTSPQIPLLLKQDMRPAEPPEGAAFKADHTAAMDKAAVADWQTALHQLELLGSRFSNEPIIHRNVALLRGYLADDAGAAVAWRRYADLAQTAQLDDAVEAETLAQLLDPQTADADRLAIYEIEYPVKDLDALMERLATDRRLQRVPFDPAAMAAEENAPPPRGVFALLDRPLPPSGVDLKLADAPRTLGDLFVFGRESDRPARVEATFSANDLDRKKQALGEIVGDLLEMPTREIQVEETSTITEAITWNYRVPDDTPMERRRQLLREQREHSLLETWPHVKQSIFGGKSAVEAANDPAFRLRVLGAIRLLELAGQQHAWQVDFNRLRSKLNLPLPQAIDPWKADVDKLLVSQYTRLDVVKLKTEKLTLCFDRAVGMAAAAAIRMLGLELVGRSDSESSIDKADVYGVLASHAQSIDESLSFIHKARDLSTAAGRSPAAWLLAELTVRIAEGNRDEMMRLIETIQSKHIREQGVAEQLMNILASYGLIPADGGRRAAARPMAAAAPAESGGLWTPGASSPASPVSASPADAGGKKSGLWLPGMD